VQATRQEQLALAEQGLSRLERLRSSAAFSQARYEDQQRQVAIARAELRSARAAIGRADADYQLARIQAERAQVTAPYPGVVVNRIVEAGAYAQSGDPLVRLVSDADLEVEADVPARRLAGLAPGTRVKLDLADGTRHEATVRAILPEENPQTRTRRVRFVPEFREPDHRRASGQSVTVQVPVGAQRQVLSVHKDAVIRQDDGAVVYLFADGQAEIRQVRLGIEIGPRFEVLDGLEPGALAVVRGNERLRPGQPLTIAERRGPSGEADAGGGS
jgi:RND family efflux transporter MFP subunit